VRTAPLLVVVALSGAACTPPGGGDAGPDAALPDALVLESPTGSYAAAADEPAITPPQPPVGAVVTVGEGRSLPLTGGQSEEVSLHVPPGTRAVHLVAFTQPGEHVGLAHARSPAGELVVDPAARPDGPGSDAGPDDDRLAIARGFPGGWFSDNRVTAAEGVAAFALPSTPDVGLAPGTWSLRFTSARRSLEAGGFVVDPGEAPALHVIPIGVPESPGDAVLPIALLFSGTGGLTAASWADDLDMARVVEVASEALAAIDVELRVAGAADVTDPALDVVTLGEGCEAGELDDLLAREVPAPGVPIHVVERFECVIDGGLDVGRGIHGLSAGLPGPAWVFGTRRSGVAIAAGELLSTPDLLGLALAHELLHFLGLFHTKENDLFGAPDHYDPISDTPEGSAAEANLMHYAVDGDSALSDGQAWVVRSSPWLLRDAE
jgi:hypothetical protein